MYLPRPSVITIAFTSSIMSHAELPRSHWQHSSHRSVDTLCSNTTHIWQSKCQYCTGVRLFHAHHWSARRKTSDYHPLFILLHYITLSLLVLQYVSKNISNSLIHNFFSKIPHKIRVQHYHMTSQTIHILFHYPSSSLIFLPDEGGD